MYAVIGFAGFFGFFIFLIRLIIHSVKKMPKRVDGIGMILCVVLFGVGVAITPPSEKTPTPSTADSSGDIVLTPQEELSADEQLEADLRTIIAENYRSTEVTQITINPNYGTEDETDRVVLIYLTWNVKNGVDMTKSMLSMYSEDLAARIGMELQAVTDMAIFWTVPYYSESENAAKFSYERNGEGMYSTDSIFTGVIK